MTTLKVLVKKTKSVKVANDKKIVDSIKPSVNTEWFALSAMFDILAKPVKAGK